MAELSTEYIKAIKKIIFKGNEIENKMEIGRSFFSLY